MAAVRMRPRGPAVTLVLGLLWLARSADGAGGASLWELGDEVDKNPMTVFSMFVLTVVFTVIVEVSKHSIEHRTHDPYRRQALQAIYAELMMLGIVSFLLVLGAELGLTEIQIRKPGCESSSSGSAASGSASGPAAAAGSGSGSSSASAPGQTPATSPPSQAPNCVWVLQTSAGLFDCKSADTCTAMSSGTNLTYSCTSASLSPTKGPTASPSGAPTVAPTGAPTTPSSGSGSGDPCLIGFDILMFEFAHLVLFFMGLTYAGFIQVAFWQRNRVVEFVRQAQKTTLREHMEKVGGWKDPGALAIMGLGNKDDFARAIIMLRNIMVLRHEDALRDCCDRTEEHLLRATAKYTGKPPPAPMPMPDDALHQFDMSRLVNIAVSEVMVELLHVPPTVWFAVIFMSASNLIHMMDIDLAEVTLLFAPFGLLLSLLQTNAMARHMSSVLHGGCGHSRLCKVAFTEAGGSQVQGQLTVPPKLASKAARWEAGEDHKHPWHKLDGCCDDNHPCNACDPLDPHALEVQMQVTVFSCCFYIGQIMMLSTLIAKDMHVLACIACWILPLVPLLVFIPRSILIYSLVHRTLSPPRHWLKYALKSQDDPQEGHGHGHGHDEHDEHDHEGGEDPVVKRRREAMDELLAGLEEEGLMSGKRGKHVTMHPDIAVGTPASNVNRDLSAGERRTDDFPDNEHNPSSLRQPLLLPDDGVARTAGSRTPTSGAGRAKLHTHSAANSFTGLLGTGSGPALVRQDTRGSRASDGNLVCPTCGAFVLVPDGPGGQMYCVQCGQRVEGNTPNTPAHLPLGQDSCETCGGAQLMPDGAGRMLCETCGHRQKAVIDAEIDPKNPFRRRRERRAQAAYAESPARKQSYRPASAARLQASRTSGTDSPQPQRTPQELPSPHRHQRRRVSERPRSPSLASSH
eukprot:TRINITY_DN8103_c1_g1_i3.p1 TRINITY_DN8103_c1_g1~~TRINITY_DN8103_c1_g1_i3.p1  ORF type:complete len:933 (+),score=262.72 TRINITY_DN8103_c1_g1_i3:61-2799(+)